MNENIDLTKILKDCPRGWKFYSTIFGDETYIIGIDSYEGNLRPITICSGKLGISVTYKISRNGHPFAESCGECCLFPSREMRDWSKFTAPWYKRSKFDPKMLCSFDKVIVRHSDEDWTCDFFSHIDIKEIEDFPYITVSGCYDYCIPYNEETKYLVGTRDEASEYYRYWED